MNGFCFITLAGLILLLAPMTAIAANEEWSGGGPFATGQGNRLITSLEISEDGATVYCGSGSGTVFSYSVSPPAISKAFGAASIPLNGTVSLSFIIINPNGSTTLSGIAFTDALPAGLAVASPNGLSGCGGGTISAVQGSGLISLSGASLAAGGSCTFSVNVTGVTIGTQNNITGNVTSVEGGTGGTALASISVNAILSIAFSGSGTVTSTSPDSAINCIKGSSSGCSGDYPDGTSVSLAATPSALSLFGGWSGGVTSGANPVTFSMDVGKMITATFNPAPLLHIGGSDYPSLQAAYDAATSGASIQLLDNTAAGTLNAGRNIAVTLMGGYDTGYTANLGSTEVTAPLTVGLGRVTMDRIEIR